MMYKLERIPRKVVREGESSPESIVVMASEDAVRGMLDSGMFALCVGQEPPCAEPEPEPEEDAAEPETDLSEEFGAFAGDGISVDLASLTNERLGELARELGIDVPKRATKAQLVALIEEARG